MLSSWGITMWYDGFFCSTEECFFWWLWFLKKNHDLVFSLLPVWRSRGISHRMPLLSSSSPRFALPLLLLHSAISALPNPSLTLISGLSWKLPARDDSLCRYAEREKEGEEKWRRCGKKELSVFSSSAPIICPLDCLRKKNETKKTTLHLYSQRCFIFSSSFIFKFISIRTK